MNQLDIEVIIRCNNKDCVDYEDCRLRYKDQNPKDKFLSDPLMIEGEMNNYTLCGLTDVVKEDIIYNIGLRCSDYKTKED